MIDAGTLTAIFGGLATLLTALTGAAASLAAARGRQADIARGDYRSMQRRLLTALQHIFTLEAELAGHGLTIPTRPSELNDDDDRIPPPAPRPA